MMRKLASAIFLLLLASAARAEIVIFSPPDKLQTSSETVILQGKADPPGEILINAMPISAIAENLFHCGLVLKPGKNLVEVRRQKEKRKIRILRTLVFPDVETATDGKPHWARTLIVLLSTVGLIESCPDGNFYPDNPITRGEFATWVVRAKKLSLPKLTGDVFFDVPKEQWRAPYVKAVVDGGYMQGISTNNFGIDDPITRREAVAVAGQMERGGFSEKAKILLREPDQPLTRAEAAVLVAWFGLAQGEIRNLLDYDQGYTKGQFCALNANPEIISFSIEPQTIRRMTKTSLKLRVQLAPRPYFSPLSKVAVDLSAIGGAADAEMIEVDGIYSLNIAYEPKEIGEKMLRVTAADRLGWEGRAESPLRVVE